MNFNNVKLLKDNLCGIYYIKNKTTNQIYVGQSIDIKLRLLIHYNSLNKETNINSENDILFNSYKKYGNKKFEFGILEICYEKYLNEKEIYWIKFYGWPDKTKIFNNTSGGKNYRHSEESKLKISISHSGKNNPMYGMTKEKNPMYNKKLSSRSRLKMSNKKINLDSLEKFEDIINRNYLNEELQKSSINSKYNFGFYLDIIKDLYSRKFTYSDLTKKYDIALNCIRGIVSHNHWSIKYANELIEGDNR